MLDHPAEASFRVETHRRPGCTSFDIIGELTSESAPALQALIRRETNHAIPEDHLRIDLLQCTELAPAVVGMLKNEQQDCTVRDVVLTVASVPDPLITTIEAEDAGSLLEPPWF